MTAGPGGAGQGGRVQGQQSSRLSERATHVTAVVVTDEVEQVAALAGGGARPPAWALAARTGQTQDQAPSQPPSTSDMSRIPAIRRPPVAGTTVSDPPSGAKSVPALTAQFGNAGNCPCQVQIAPPRPGGEGSQSPAVVQDRRNRVKAGLMIRFGP